MCTCIIRHEYLEMSILLGYKRRRFVRTRGRLRGVYPRACWGICVTFGHLPCALGLSPRVRGNHTHRGRGSMTERSIPACAGESFLQPDVSGVMTVYPRVCGGIGLVFNHEASDGHGLSYRHAAADHRLKGPRPTAQV